MFHSPNTGRASNKNFINSLTKPRKLSHPQPSISIPPFQVQFSLVSIHVSCIILYFLRLQILVRTLLAATVLHLLVLLCNKPIPRMLLSSRSFIFQVMPLSLLACHSCYLRCVAEITYQESAEVTLETHPLPVSPSSHHDEFQFPRTNDRTVSVSGSTSTDSDRTPVRVDSQDSQVSDSDTVIDGNQWPRQNSVSLNNRFCCQPKNLFLVIYARVGYSLGRTKNWRCNRYRPVCKSMQRLLAWRCRY